MPVVTPLAWKPVSAAPTRSDGSGRRFSSQEPSEVATTETYIRLGRSNLLISKLGIGTLQWGDPSCGYGSKYGKEDLRAIFQAATAAGVNFFDTAEVYGYQGNATGTSSEHLLGSFIADASASSGTSGVPPLVVATKYFTVPWTNVLLGGGFRLGRAALLEALRGSVKRLGRRVDVYQIHFPFPTYSASVLADGLQEALEEGLVQGVGVCNYNLQQLEEMYTQLEQRAIPLLSNQVKYNLLNRDAESSGLLRRCAELGVTLVAHSPLEQGLLTSKNVSEAVNPKASAEVQSLLKLLQFVGVCYGGKSVTQVALAYLIAKGAVPIPGCKSVSQAKDSLGSLGWQLEENEVAILDERVAAMA